MEPETQFLQGLLELQYGQKVQDKLSLLATKVPWAKNWPSDNTSFWNAEAFMWGYKIEKEKRAVISKELSFLEKGNNLDLGCGSYSYLPSVGFDLSPKMLQFNDNLSKKVQGDLEKKLPFDKEEFESVTAVFVLNYVKNHSSLIQEVYRILKPGGWLMVVLYSKQVNDWQRQKEVSALSASAWTQELEKHFKVNFYLKEDLYFFKCQKVY